MKQKRLIDQIKERVAARPPMPVPKTWLTRLPEDVQEQLLAIRAQWKEGAIVSSAKGLAADIVAECKELGFATCANETMRTWLTKD